MTRGATFAVVCSEAFPHVILQACEELVHMKVDLFHDDSKETHGHSISRWCWGGKSDWKIGAIVAAMWSKLVQTVWVINPVVCTYTVLNGAQNRTPCPNDFKPCTSNVSPTIVVYAPFALPCFEHSALFLTTVLTLLDQRPRRTITGNKVSFKTKSYGFPPKVSLSSERLSPSVLIKANNPFRPPRPDHLA